MRLNGEHASTYHQMLLFIYNSPPKSVAMAHVLYISDTAVVSDILGILPN